MKITIEDLQHIFQGDIDWLGPPEDRDKELNEIVTALERNARLEAFLKELDEGTLWPETPCDWNNISIHSDIEKYLRAIRDGPSSEDYKEIQKWDRRSKA